ncbi:dicarboxylate/amino acid:cation symporter [Thiospirochaeta perfilievii]|uniref:Dicarboxylate/amino acid:cation symporter n=1 Tax=Thiospirochaeta perfilievii TaxID=252967 RepID=A0A5C1QF86_9SPIO|nr:cation:dicarboxylase symporter family transporter [Thiospirochaeta perfilievii]QEN04852.1 dicarboxylate/amino acid:cation symporter [Thiospirochaeta perfilievii]
MKTSVQVLVGAVLGALIAVLLPADNLILTFITGLSTNLLLIGRYIVLPLMFFSLIVSVTQLQRDKLLVKNSFKLLALSAIFALLLVIVGITSSLLFSPGQIPVVIDGIQSVSVPSFQELLNQSFPGNIFSIFQGNFDGENNQFIPFFVLAIILGVFFTITTREEIEPTFNLVDSLSRLFFKINEYFFKISYIWVAILTAAYVIQIKNILDITIFLPLTIMLGTITFIVLFVIYPLIFYFVSGKKNPFKFMFLEIPTLISTIITGDQFFSSGAVILTQKREFKIKREYSGYNIPLLTLFSKAGTALVSVITFIVILKSYSSLEITATQILWVGVMSFLISFCLPTKMVGSSIASLFLLCALYGYGGIEDSFIILSPSFPILASVSTLLNAATIIIINTIMDPDKRV